MTARRASGEPAVGEAEMDCGISGGSKENSAGARSGDWFALVRLSARRSFQVDAVSARTATAATITRAEAIGSSAERIRSNLGGGVTFMGQPSTITPSTLWG